MLCPNCQTPLREGAQFCTGCGARTSAGGGVSADSTPTIVRGGASEADALVGRVLDEKYEVLGRLGEGGMGAVYRARRVHIGDEVAVKVLHTKYVGDPTLVERFRREARAAAQLHHPNVVTIHDYGEARGAEGFAYIVMELVAGDSLRELLRREGRLPVARAASLMRDICAGVGAAHRREIVHRDLKPDNIIVLPPDDDHERERVKVVDFGIAKLRDMASDSTLTQAGSMVGTPFYMSPEQCRGESLDARADVYSLGALLYEMLAGTPPFNAPTVTGVIAKHLTEAPPALPEALNVPAALQAAVARALAKDPAVRQRDATEFAREVQAAASQAAPGWAAGPVAPEPFFPATGQHVTPTSPAQTAGVPARAHQTQGQSLPAQTYAPQPVVPAPPRRSRAPLYLLLTLLVVTVLSALVGGTIFYIGRQEDKKRAAANANAARPRTSPTPAANANANAPKPAAVSPALERAEQKVVTGAPLTEADLAALSPAELRLLRNVPFARHGRAFQTPELKQYFESRPWYRPRADFRESALSDADRANAERIKTFESGGKLPAADPEAARREVSRALEGWVESTRARDLNAHASFYADTLETFYQRQNVPSAQVLADRARAFTRYHELNVELANVEITPDAAGARATAVFDKTWEFEADDKTSSGSVRQQLVLVKTGGRWLITGEKDLEVHSKTSEEY
jgi:eukaryotic-like serine/threonine-protein kinase